MFCFVIALFPDGVCFVKISSGLLFFVPSFQTWRSGLLKIFFSACIFLNQVVLVEIFTKMEFVFVFQNYFNQTQLSPKNMFVKNPVDVIFDQTVVGFLTVHSWAVCWLNDFVENNLCTSRNSTVHEYFLLINWLL